MTRTLFDLTYQVALKLGQVREGLATGGSTTTLIDTVNLVQPDDYWGGSGENIGSVWILKDAAGAGEAPEGEFARVTDFVNSTKTATIETLTAAPASGDRYGIANARYPLDLLIQKVNATLDDLGPVTQVDTTTLDTVSAQTEYSLPVADMDLRQVWIQGLTGDANDNRWYEVHDWHVLEQGAGTADLLVFRKEYIASRDIMLVYVAPHAALYANSDQLNERVPFELIVARAAVGCLEHRLNRLHDPDPKMREQLQRMQNEADRQSLRTRMKTPMRRPPRFILGTFTAPDHLPEPPQP